MHENMSGVTPPVTLESTHPSSCLQAWTNLCQIEIYDLKEEAI